MTTSEAQAGVNVPRASAAEAETREETAARARAERLEAIDWALKGDTSKLDARRRLRARAYRESGGAPSADKRMVNAIEELQLRHLTTCDACWAKVRPVIREMARLGTLDPRLRALLDEHDNQEENDDD